MAMVWARVILVLISLVSSVLSWQSYIYTYIYTLEHRNPFWIVGMIVSPPIFLAALTVLLLSFINFEKRNGQYVVRESMLLRYLLFFGAPGSEYDNRVTICSLFWRTVFAVYMTAALIFIVGVFLWLLISNLKMALITIVLLIGTFFVVNCAVNWFNKRSERTKTIWGNVAFTCLVCLGIAMVGLLVLSMKPAQWGILLLFILGIFAAGGLVVLIFKGIGSLRKTTVGEVLNGGWQAVKSRTCPIVSVVSFKS